MEVENAGWGKEMHSARYSERLFIMILGGKIMEKANLIKRFFVALFLVAWITGCAGSSKHESTGEYMDDSIITTKVKAAIFNDPVAKVFQVKVETFKGVVQLSGFVESQEVATRAVEAARSVGGVKDVINKMSVK